MIDFAAEQRALAAACWHFVGVREQLAEPNAWIRRTVFGHDVFIQSFAGELRGYHNICAHRGFPIRTADAGVGPVQCGFHGWVYSRDGVPTGIPRNAELFGLSRDAQRELALEPVRVETIGRFVFACVSPTAPPLAEYLGRHAAVLRTVDALIAPLRHHAVIHVRANWKRHVEITHDDYHLATVHPSSFGTLELPLPGVVYEREGLHSSYLWRRDADWSFAPFWAGLARGEYDGKGYKIYNCFPATLASTALSNVVLSAATPIAAAETRVDSYLMFWKHDTSSDEHVRGVIEANLKIWEEDRVACETWELGCDRLPHAPPLGKLEERVGWFREAYAKVVG